MSRPSFVKSFNTDFLTELSVSQTAVLSICSVLGPKFDLETLQLVVARLPETHEETSESREGDGACASSRDQRTHRIVTKLVSALILFESSNGERGREFSFASESIQKEVYDSIDIERKRKLHSIVAQTYESSGRKVACHVLSQHWRMAHTCSEGYIWSTRLDPLERCPTSSSADVNSWEG
jgi:hypothetical protein